MADLRAITSRARITRTSLENVYHFGDFKGDPIEPATPTTHADGSRQTRSAPRADPGA